MEPIQVNIAVKKIKEVEFSINEEIDIPGPIHAIVRFELTTNFNLNDNTVELLLTTFFSTAEEDNLFLKIKTSNVFLLLELSNFYSTESQSFNIPNNVLVTFLSLSISHSRALLAKNVPGTKFADLYIPIVNPTEVSKQLFNN